MTTPLTWAARVELVKGYRAGACDTKGTLTGHDTFNLAACYALGFGVCLSHDESFRYLEIAAREMYIPARVLRSVFHHNGLIPDSQPVSDSNDDLDQCLASLEDELLQLPPMLRFTARLRGYYKNHFAQMSSRCFTIVEFDKTFKDVESIKDLLLAEVESLHELTVTLNIYDRSIVTPLMHHLISSHEEFAEVLLLGGAITEVLNEDEVSLLIIACVAGSSRIVRVLLNLSPQLAFKHSRDGISPLHWLFMFSDLEIPSIAKLLVDHKASFLQNAVVELADFNMVLSGLPLHWAVMTRSIAAARALIELGADVDQPSFALSDHLQYPEYAVDLAVSLHMPEMVQLLIDSGAITHDRPKASVPPALHYIGDATDPFRAWLLHGVACEEAAQQTIKVLVAAGADINARSDDGLTALHHAAHKPNNQTYVIELILRLQPSVATGNDHLRSPLYFASIALQHDRVNHEKLKLILNYCREQLAVEEFNGICKETLRNCTEDGTLCAASEILAALGTDTEIVIEEKQLMHLAAEHDQPEMLRLFLSTGANIDTEQEGTPAACAAARGKTAALGFLLSRGASALSLPVSGYGDTILHEIVSPLVSPDQSYNTLKYIYENFRELLIPFVDNYNMFGFTALHEAIIWGNIKNVALLLERFMASSLNVKDTGVSPATLALLLKTSPPLNFSEQGATALLEYRGTIDAIIDYLCETHELEPPDISSDVAGVRQYLATPSQQLWAPGDSVASWRIKVD